MITRIFFIIFCSIVICYPRFAQTNSEITYDPGTTLDISAGADLCATNIVINGTYSGGGSICDGPLPVSLTSFTSTVDKRTVILQWITTWELNNSGFDVERKAILTDGQWSRISFVPGSGTTSELKSYYFKDEKLNTGKYEYRLKQMDYNGNFEYYSLADEVTITPPNIFSMSQNYPNPGNPNSKINFDMPVDGRVSIKIYDIIGREVITLIDEIRTADYYTVEFNGGNLASGVYIYRLVAEGEGQKFTDVKKMMLVK